MLINILAGIGALCLASFALLLALGAIAGRADDAADEHARILGIGGEGFGDHAVQHRLGELRDHG